MSIDRYFDKFPTISYKNNLVVDITKRVTLLEKVSRNPYIFYPYDIVSDERADQLSSRYYQDSYKSWMLYLSNKITDPYYEWYLTEKEFLEFIEKKYGSLYNSYQKTKFYRNAWESTENLDVSGYNALSFERRKYWEPNYQNNLPNVISYSRKQVDWAVSTNRIMSYEVANNNFIKDEIVNITLDNGQNFGKGQVLKTLEDQVYVYHVSGFYDVHEETTTYDQSNNITNGYMVGTESLVNTNVLSVNTVLVNIPEDEIVYWKPITYYDYEYEKNEYNRSIRIIDKDQAETAVNNLTELLSE